MNNFKSKATQFLLNLAQKVSKMMIGRYGPDNLYRFLTYSVLVIVILNMFIKSKIISLICLLLLAYNTFRVMSKNYNIRYAENQIYMNLTSKVRKQYNITKKRLTDKDHVYRTCPECSKTLRFKRVKGKHNVKCPNCSKEFEIKI